MNLPVVSGAPLLRSAMNRSGSVFVLLLRVAGLFIPQVLLVLLVGGRYDLLLGLNRTDAGFNLLLLFFILAPASSALFLLAEAVSCHRKRKRNETISVRQTVVAALVFLESLALDGVVL